MPTPKRTALALTIFCLACASHPATSPAQTAKTESHPAYQVVVSYLTYAMGQEWAKTAALIESESLTGLRDRYMERISTSPTLKQEIEMCRTLDCANLTEAKTLDPTDFYIRYHKGIQKRFEVSPEKIAAIIKSKRVKLLSLGEETHEGIDLCHVLVRTKHNNGTNEISSLELISLIKVDGKWLVTLNAMRPTIAEGEEDSSPKK